MGLVNNTLCNFCHSFQEDIMHMLWFCEITQTFLGEIHNWLYKCFGNELSFNMSNYMLGDPEACDILNCLYIMLKKYIYRCKIQETTPKFKQFVSIVKYHESIEKYIYAVRQRPNTFRDRWNLITYTS